MLRNGALPKAVTPVDDDRVAIGYSNGSIAVVETYDVRVVPGGPAFGTTVFELKEEHLMKKLWSGLMPTLGTKYARTRQPINSPSLARLRARCSLSSSIYHCQTCARRNREPGNPLRNAHATLHIRSLRGQQDPRYH